jgi:TrmH RNA methyltransferase
MNNGNQGGDDNDYRDVDDNIGNRADGPPTHDGPRPPRFAGEGQSRRQRLGLGHDRPRRERGPRRGGGEPDGNVAPPGFQHPMYGGAPQGGNAGGGFASRGDQQPGGGYPREDRGGGRRGPRRGRRGGGGRGGDHQGFQPGNRSSEPPRERGDQQPGYAPPFQGAEGQPQGQPFERGPRPYHEGRNEQGGRGGRRGGRDRGPRHPDQQQGRDDRPRGGIREDETKVYGVNACQAVFDKRPDAIIRAYVNNDMLRRFGYTMKFLAEQRRAYHVVSEDELRRVTGSEHHGGVCFVIRKRQPLELIDFLRLFGEQPKCRALLLEGVGNPHNVGAVLRSAAHFGVDAVLVEDAGYAQGGAAARVAEGAAETVRLVRYRGAARALAVLKQAGFTRVVTSSHAAQPLYAAEVPEKAVFVFGAEGTGISPQAAELADLALAIPGSGAVESLNVSVAAGVLLSELYRRHGLAGQTEPVPGTREWVLPPEEVEAPRIAEPMGSEPAYAFDPTPGNEALPAPTAPAQGDDQPTMLGGHTPPL